MAVSDQKIHRLTTINEYFVDMLGGQALTDLQQADVRRLAASIRLGEADPFWAIVAFLYARSPNDTLDMERLRKTAESMNQFRDELDSKLTSFSGDVENLAKRIPEITKAGIQEALQEVLKNGSPAGATINAAALDTLHAKIKADIDGITSGQVARPTFREWLGDRWHHVMYGFGGILGLLVISVLGAYWIGSAAGEDTGKAAALQQESATQKFINAIPADDRDRMLAWMNLNRSRLNAITSCDVTGWIKKDYHGSVACYPQGGQGFYAVPEQGMMSKAAEAVRAYLP